MMTKLDNMRENKETFQHAYNYVYILLCSNNSYYTGYTTNMIRRYQEHIKGTTKCKFTRCFKPLKIAQCWKAYGDRNIAMKAEKYIKSLNKKAKEHLIEFPHKLTEVYQNHPNFKYLSKRKF